MSKILINEKSFLFAKRIIKLFQLLQERKEFILSKQLIRSGTSIGANIREAKYAESKADFIHKMKISRKEASETIYWLDLLFETEIITNDEYKSINQDANEILRILTSIILSSERGKTSRS